MLGSLDALWFILGSWVIILSLWLGIQELKKLGAFLKVMHSNAKIKHSRKIMRNSFIKYLAVLFILVLFTYEIFIYPMIPVWLLAIYMSLQYIRLWKYHGFSVVLLIVAACSGIIASIFISPFIYAGLAILMRRFGNITMIIATAGLIAYAVFSKYSSATPGDELNKFRKMYLMKNNDKKQK